MQFDVVDGDGKVKALVIGSICPFCGKKTAKKLGTGVIGQFASRAAAEGELICYHCKNPDCEHVNYYVRKVDFEEHRH